MLLSSKEAIDHSVVRVIHSVMVPFIKFLPDFLCHLCFSLMLTLFVPMTT